MTIEDTVEIVIYLLERHIQRSDWKFGILLILIIFTNLLWIAFYRDHINKSHQLEESRQ